MSVASGDKWQMCQTEINGISRVVWVLMPPKESDQLRAGGTEDHTRLITSEIVGSTPTPVNEDGTWRTRGSLLGGMS